MVFLTFGTDVLKFAAFKLATSLSIVNQQIPLSNWFVIADLCRGLVRRERKNCLFSCLGIWACNMNSTLIFPKEYPYSVYPFLFVYHSFAKAQKGIVQWKMGLIDCLTVIGTTDMSFFSSLSEPGTKLLGRSTARSINSSSHIFGVNFCGTNAEIGVDQV